MSSFGEVADLSRQTPCSEPITTRLLRGDQHRRFLESATERHKIMDLCGVFYPDRIGR